MVNTEIFRDTWKKTIVQYDELKGLALEHQIVDACFKKSPLGGDKTGRSPVDRRKLGSKIVLIVDKNGVPISSIISSANKHDSQLLEPIFEDIQRHINQSRNHYFHTDKGFISAKNSLLITSRNYKKIMPVKKKRGSHYLLRQEKDILRWVIERTFSWISRFRRLFTRYERKSTHYQALVQFACQIIIFNKI